MKTRHTVPGAAGPATLSRVHNSDLTVRLHTPAAPQAYAPGDVPITRSRPVRDRRSPIMPVSTRIYIGDALGFGGQPTLDDLISAGYSTVLAWSVHVADGTGDLSVNNTTIVSNGRYQEAEPMGLPGKVALLRKAGVEVLFSVGSGPPAQDFTNIANLLGTGIPGPENVLYKNFSALLAAMQNAGGDLAGIDFDNEDNVDAGLMVTFGRMLHEVGYAHVTLCPAFDTQIDAWRNTLATLNETVAPDYVNAVHLQCYAGGSGNIGRLQEWQDMIASANPTGTCDLIPGLATTQPKDGPWWNMDRPGASVVENRGLAIDGAVDWSKLILIQSCPTGRDAALQVAQNSGGVTFFIYCNAPVAIGGRSFRQGDAVFFAGVPRWSPVPQCDTYYLSGCSDRLNGIGACPADLQRQYRTWRDTITKPPQGGFIWIYDSVVWCYLAGGCGGSEQRPATTARDYRDAIVNGLTPGDRDEDHARP
jgi:hypothetical protein